jgi:branched-chain amino acid transport system ATP-binding protein
MQGTEAGGEEGVMRAEPRAAAAHTPGTRLLLEVSHLDVAYGDVQVLWDVSLDVADGEIVALIGANGAGKTTLLSTISGLLQPRAGEIRFDGASLVGASSRTIVRRGIAHVPEGRRLFAGMTVRDNLLMGAYPRSDKSTVNADLERVLELFPRLKVRLRSLGGDLSGGEQQMVALGRALMSRPRLLMLDELSLGLAPIIVETLVQTIKQINAEGTTVLMVEQDAQTALEISNRGYVLETGRVTLAGPSAELLNDERVKQAYLGI